MTENKDNKSSKGQWHGGKGSIQKPSDQDKYSENYDKIFGKKKKDKEQIKKVQNVQGHIKV